jgi:hypothetical protein
VRLLYAQYALIPPRKPTTVRTKNVPSVSEMPVTRAMFLGVRDELRSLNDQTHACLSELNARFERIESGLDEVRATLLELLSAVKP